MKDTQKNFLIVVVILLGVLTTVTIIVQIATIGEETTKTEATLFNILQFLFALAFAWVLSRITSKEEYKESQKKFAISAFRRINEIDISVQRLVSRTRKTTIGKEEVNTELEVINAIGVNIQHTIKSSIADWADIIGDEITTIERIQKLEQEQSELLQQNDDESSQEMELFLDKFNQQEKKIEELIKTLPESLKIEKELKNRDNAITENMKLLMSNIEENNGLVLRGFYDDSFSKSFLELNPGDQLTIGIYDVAKRIGVLAACNEKEEPIGVIINKLGNRYHEHVESIFRIVGKSKFQAELISIEPSEKSERIYFKVKVNELQPTKDKKT